MTSTLATNAGPLFEPPLDDRLLLAELGTDVVIVGAGPAGAALGFLFSSRGLRTVLVERHESFDREFRGEGLQPSGRICLEQMGLSDAFAAVPQARMEHFRLNTGRRTVRLPVPIAEDEAPVLVSQPKLLEMLTREADAFPNFRLARGLTVTGLVREGGRVTGVETNDYPEEIKARLVIGADGRGSVVRRATELVTATLEQEFDLLWLKADLSSFLPDRETVHMDFAGEHLMTVFPSPGGCEQLGVVLPKGSLRKKVPGDRLQWILDHASDDLREALEGARLSIVGPVALKVVCDRLERWNEPGVLLVGDAAHTMSPVGGQGINMALRDAIVAANHLVPALQAGATDDAIDLAAAAVAVERLPEIERIQELQTKEAPRLLHPSRVMVALTPLLMRVPGLVQRLSRRRAKMRAGLATVVLRV